MKQYLKMADVFGGAEVGIRKDAPSLVDCCGVLAANCLSPKTARHVAHAINSHDELVQMNQELLAALESVIEWYDMEADHSIEPDFYKRMAACQVSEDMAREAIAKAKGSAS